MLQSIKEGVSRREESLEILQVGLTHQSGSETGGYCIDWGAGGAVGTVRYPYLLLFFHLLKGIGCLR